MVNSTSIYLQFKESLKKMVLEKNLHPGDKIPSERDLAEQYGVCRITMNKAVSELVTEGLLYREKGKGTFVASHKRKKLAEDRKRIGVSFLDIYNITHPYFSKLVNSINASCNKNGYSLQVFSTHASEIDKSPFISAIKSGHLSGVLLASRMGLKNILLLKEMNVPFVWVNHDIPEEDINCVLVDYFSATFNAIKHLIGLGHKRIGLIRGSKDNRDTILSLSGYKFILEEQGIDFDINLVRGTAFTEEMGYMAMNELLNLSQPPTAVYAIDDSLAAGAMKAIAEKGLRIPDDTAIVGCGNLLSAYSTEPSLTTLDIHLEKLGELALEMLLKMIEKKKVEETRVMLKPTLIIRQSCGINQGRESVQKGR